ncbi:MAG: Toxin-antitoxin system, toxin component, Fic family [Candidatus Daviesbacteria bacterium GW2011_GWA2_38_24]|uniref:Toxin-antitoxin system, toxin component, Fic family n=1 Tax=Candidatus Daviesbacteria bacterium GW2011_GWA2_38_24 TaxID=1618422 RepID=A0A0G0JMP1_9BACT|nr:MAG: Toxin-antitoxin system, toxin component, Fic family [Candidatus Daviesbacteria bacterium GW2011_GWA2_38_24]
MNNQDKNNQIIIYNTEDGEVKIEARMKDETVWLSQVQLAELFGTTKANISIHIKNIFEEGELTKDATVKEYLTVQIEGNRKVSRDIEYYNLDLIIAVGYRVKSQVATRFRQWATARLREYIVKGFVIDDERLKETGGGNYWKELLNRIRDIRSSEKALYRQVLDLYATSIDYDPKSDTSIEFFKVVQNKLHYATNQHTAAEIIHSRADAEKDFMGLTTFAGVLPVLSEVGIAKNYLTEDELFRLNRMVSAFFDLAEIKAQEHTKMTMADWVAELDKFADNFGKGILKDAGNVSHKQATEKAAEEYRKYQAKTLSPVEEVYLESIKILEKKVEKK